MSDTGTAQAPGSEAGFSLIEVLVALTILAIASASLIGIGESHIQRIDRLETGAIGSLVAENRLAELRIDPDRRFGAVADIVMLDRAWAVATRTQPTDDPQILRIDIEVTERGSASPAANLTGFIDIGVSQ